MRQFNANSPDANEATNPQMDMLQATELGRKIEKGSFDIIDQEIGPQNRLDGEWNIVRRIIHATADFEFQKLCAFHPHAIQSGIATLKKGGSPLIVDVQMIAVGLNQKRLAHFGCPVHCFINDPDVLEIAQKKGNTTRAIEAMNKAAKLGLLAGSIIAIGNAPTALLHLAKLIETSQKKENLPALIIGVPVGFVSAAESKDVISAQTLVPWIVTKGRKGGSPIAVAILHALFSMTATATATATATRTVTPTPTITSPSTKQV